MADRIANVLFLCTGNSARSILAEAIMNKLGLGRFCAYSAGSHPKGTVNPLAIALLNQLGFPTAHLSSKSWDQFAQPDAPIMDYIITVCDQAAGEACPFWPGRPLAAHWGLPDPAAVEGNEAERMAAFHQAYDILEARIRYFLSLPIETLGSEELKRNLRAAGSVQPQNFNAQS